MPCLRSSTSISDVVIQSRLRLFSPLCFWKKDNIRRNVRQGILTECRLRQAHSPQKISLIGNILTSGRVCRIHEIAADDNAAMPPSRSSRMDLARK